MQDTALERGHEEVDREPEEAGGEGDRVELVGERVGAGVVRRLAEPGVPMKSSAVKARISATAEARRSPVTMYGSALGSVIRHSRSNRPTPNDRAVSIATGSTSRTPYIVCTRSGQNAPKAARKSSLFSDVPKVRKSSGITTTDGIGRRNSIGTRNAFPAKSLEPRRIPIGTASAVAIASPSPQPRIVWRRSLQNARVCMSSHSSRTVALIDGRSVSEMRPVRERISQTANAAAIESTTRAASPIDPRRSRARGARCVFADAVIDVMRPLPRGGRREPRSRQPCARAPARAAGPGRRATPSSCARRC